MLAGTKSFKLKLCRYIFGLALLTCLPLSTSQKWSLAHGLKEVSYCREEKLPTPSLLWFLFLGNGKAEEEKAASVIAFSNMQGQSRHFNRV